MRFNTFFWRILARMKPHQLICALMHRQRLSTAALSRALKQPKLQPSLHRFVRGEVREPARAIAEALATYFQVPTDAIYSGTVAASVASKMGLSVVDWPPAHQKRQAQEQRSGDKLSEAAAMVAALPPDQRQRLIEIFLPQRKVQR